MSYRIWYDNIMNNQDMIIKNDETLLVSCCGCAQDLRITRDEANEWIDISGFMCQECD